MAARIYPRRFWHGGAPGRKPGDKLLPPSITGLTFTRRDMSIAQGLTEIAQRADLVYLTTDRELARAYAGLWTLDDQVLGGGALYRVEPDEPPEPDEDLLSLAGLSWQVRSATIGAVYDAYVRFDLTSIARSSNASPAAHPPAARADRADVAPDGQRRGRYPSRDRVCVRRR